MKERSESLKDTERVACGFFAALKPQEKATVIGLSGDLGAGKTAFVKMVAAMLGVKETIQSPTFVIMKRYELKKANSQFLISNFQNLIHIDAYRLDKGEDILKLGFKDWCDDKNNLILVEWPEQIHDAMPKNSQTIHFSFINETTRDIEIL